TEKLKKALQQDLMDYRAIPFWSWNNELKENELVQQIDQMQEAGAGGFIMHARLGLTTEYLGKKWFSCIGACLNRAKELGMNAWVYDENGWPSGFVGGKLLEIESYRAQFLEYEIKSYFEESAFAVLVESDGGYERENAPQKGGARYHTIYLRTSPANTDILNPEVVDAFIQETYEKYYERFKDSFGKELTGFFTDEPQYYRWGTPYSRMIAKAYREKYGEDVKDGLIWLFLHAERGYEFRIRYYTIANDLYVENFYKKLYDWCTDHNCKLTGHTIEENHLWAQMLGGAGCMPTYEYEHIPAIDCLSKKCETELGVKQLGSVASQLGIKQVLTESFGCAGYDVTPRELKSLGELQYFNGVNLLCHHLFPYSIAGQAKHDHPPIFSKHSNWWNGFRTFNDHFAKLGYIVANTEENYDVLVIHPMRSVYLDWVRGEAEKSVQDLERAFEETLQILRKNGILFQLADERLLSRYGKVENGKLVVGKNAYDTVIVPTMKNISATTVDLLKAYHGKLLVENIPAWVDGVKAECSLVSNCTYADIIKNAQVKFYCEDGMARITARKGEFGDFLFLKNYSIDAAKRVQMQGVAERYKALDLEKFELENITNDYTLPPYGSLILMKDETAKEEKVKLMKEDVTSAFSVTGITDNYLVCDFCSIGYDGKNFGETAFIHKHFDALLKADYKGKLFVKHTFKVNEKMPLKLIMEKGNFFSVTVNGREVVPGKNDFDFNFQEVDITECIRVGENEFIYGVDYYQHDGVHFALFDPLATESVRNCLYYDTHLENVYVKGSFVVNEDLSLSPRKALPNVSTELYRQGYPFFNGKLFLEGEYTYDGVGARSLSLVGRYQMVEISIGDETVDMTLCETMDITRYLKTGKNKLRLTVYSSLRNLFGPHHCKRAIEAKNGVSPAMFTMRGEWVKGTPAHYTDEHVSVPFGLDLIEIISKREND
ncbi:MAG: hypothetical protein IJB97_09075, partial [Clostridia bacterium]|nr:hypothetical protein [Clostridia bacterium]